MYAYLSDIRWGQHVVVKDQEGRRDAIICLRLPPVPARNPIGGPSIRFFFASSTTLAQAQDLDEHALTCIYVQVI